MTTPCRCRYIEDYGFDRTPCRAEVHADEPRGETSTPTPVVTTLSHHCCFLGCRMVRCGFCREERCMYDLHLCEPEPSR